MKKVLYISLLLCTFFIQLFSQQTIRVPSDKPTIAAALDAAKMNTTILVSSGTYFENLVWPKGIDGIKLISLEGSLRTIIDGNKKGRVIQMEEDFDPNNLKITTETVIQGFTIRNGDYTDRGGAGLYCSYANPKLKDLIFETNNGHGSAFNGGGAYLNDFNGEIENCHFLNNTINTDSRSYGAGLYIQASNDIKINNCTFVGNIGITHNWCFGGGLYLDYYDLPNGKSTIKFEVINCKFINNSTSTENWSYGAGLYCDESFNNASSLLIESCLFQNNTTNTSSWSFGGGANINMKETEIKNSRFINNSSVNGSGVYFETFDQFNKAKIEKSTFQDNIVLLNNSFGGGIISAGYDAFELIMINSVIDNNNSVPIYINDENSILKLNHCTIFNNSKGVEFNNCKVTANNSIFWNKPSKDFTETSNISFQNCIVKGLSQGSQAINKDPLMLSPSIPIPSPNSPCLNTGVKLQDVTTDIMSSPRPMPANSNPDIGAYEIDQYFAHVLVKYYYDINQNGAKDINEKYLGIGSIKDHNSQVHINYSPEGTYIILNQGPASLDFVNDAIPKWKLSGKGSYQFNVNGSSFAEKIEIGLFPIIIQSQLETNLVGERFRCGEEVCFTLSLTNYGTNIESGSFWLEIDQRLDKYVFETKADLEISKNRFQWNFKDLNPGEKIEIKFTTTAPLITTPNQVGEKYYFCHGISAISLRDDNCYVAELRCSFDPNDKFATPQRQDNLVLIDKPLTYTVRFQNTGNDYARHVIIKDTIDKAFNLNSLRVLHSSHPDVLNVSYNDSREVTFNFKNIFLPDSTTNNSGSNGHVTYSLEYNKDAKPRTEVKNTAHIYFDFNPAIVTNTTENVIVLQFPTKSSDLSKSNIEVFPNPTTNQLFFSKIAEKVLLYDLNGRIVLEANNTNTMELNVEKAVYILTLKLNGIFYKFKIIVI